MREYVGFFSSLLEPSREAIFVLGIGQQTFKILLYSHESSSSYNTDSPYRIVWKLVDIEGDFVALTKLEVLAILRSALIAHKRGNPWIQTPNVVVECLF